MTATDDAVKALVAADEDWVSGADSSNPSYWQFLLDGIPTNVLARVVAERPDRPTPLFEGEVADVFDDSYGAWFAIVAIDGEPSERLLSAEDRRVVVLAAPTGEDSDHE